jgi:hypothetical protein
MDDSLFAADVSRHLEFVIYAVLGRFDLVAEWVNARTTRG